MGKLQLRNLPTKSSRTKVGEFGLISKFPGYRAREDQTTQVLGTLVPPSQNVVMTTAGRPALVKGYALDGTGSVVQDSGILSNTDFTTFKGDVRNMRAGFLTNAGNDGKLQYRYRTGAGTIASPYVINWVDLKTALTTVRLSFCEFWDTTALVKKLLWVDGSNNVIEWNGAVTTFASATATTLTKQGTNTWAQEGFAQTGTRSVVVNGVTATYTGGEGTTTLTGVSVDFSATAVGAIIHQLPVTTALSTMTAILATFGPTVIGCGRNNQVYLGASNSNNIYISKVNNYKDYTFTSPGRLAGEGFLLPLDAPPTKFVPMEMRTDENSYDMWISEGLNNWSVVRGTLSADLTGEKLEHIRLKVAPLQGAKSERLVAKMKNHIMFIGNDNVANFFGFLSYQNIPSSTDFSYPIIDDMNSYDFTDGSIFYHRNYVIVCIPKAGITRLYNMTDQSQEENSSYKGIEDVTSQPWFWESPITYPISGCYVVDGALYGHSYTTSESYKLFTGGNLNGQQIDANATFAFDDKGDRAHSKVSDSIYVEGYIKQNTVLSTTVAGDLNGFQISQTKTIDGSDNNIVAYGSGGHAIGKNPIGSQPVGGAMTNSSTLPAWFHVIKTYSQQPSYLEQVSFSTKGVDLAWELLTFGTNASMSAEGNNSITQ